MSHETVLDRTLFSCLYIYRNTRTHKHARAQHTHTHTHTQLEDSIKRSLSANLLGAFTGQLQEAAIGLVMPVRLSVRLEQRTSHPTDFVSNISHLTLLLIFIDTLRFCKYRPLHTDLHTCMIPRCDRSLVNRGS
jgi:hypothetical protein